MDFTYLKQAHSFRTLIDIGANNGEYGMFLRRFFGIGQAIAFEPQQQHRQALQNLGFQTHSLALSNKAGEETLSVTQMDGASSLRPVAEVTRLEWGEAVSEVRTDVVKTARLDDCITGAIEPDCLIKVDAQGFETEIIDGGLKTFASASCVLIEVSFVPLYAGQGLFSDIHGRLERLKFSLSGFKSQQDSKVDGRPLFAHAVYEK